ncbi:MAG: DM13 domain-containing protein [Parcubacteria group bacterium]|nr:DM13 domain-containing protein [Parcubacteria group bacterium]
MKKLILALIIVAALVFVGVYYFGFHTYFIENRVSEKLPQMVPNGQTELPQEPAVVKQGNFVDADSFHKGSGNAYILEYPDAKKILRFENFETVNGPDLYVYLAQNSAPTNNLNSLGDYIDLGRLKGNIGDQNYELPQNISTDDYQAVAIWCKKFGVLFPYAVLK